MYVRYWKKTLNVEYIPLILYLVNVAGREDPLGSNGREIKALSISVPSWKVILSVCNTAAVSINQYVRK